MDIDRDTPSSPLAPLAKESSTSSATPASTAASTATTTSSTTNGAPSTAETERSPTPPPHTVPTDPTKRPVDPEAFKLTGNKYFKAGEYQKAILEYSKGSFSNELMTHKNFFLHRKKKNLFFDGIFGKFLAGSQE
jgi:DnaJ family protein C protein 7